MTTIRLARPRDIIDHVLQDRQSNSMMLVTENLTEFKTTIAEFVDPRAGP